LKNQVLLIYLKQKYPFQFRQIRGFKPIFRGYKYLLEGVRQEGRRQEAGGMRSEE